MHSLPAEDLIACWRQIRQASGAYLKMTDPLLGRPGCVEGGDSVTGTAAARHFLDGMLSRV